MAQHATAAALWLMDDRLEPSSDLPESLRRLGHNPAALALGALAEGTAGVLSAGSGVFSSILSAMVAILVVMDTSISFFWAFFLVYQGLHDFA